MKALSTFILPAIVSCLWSCRATNKISQPYLEAAPLQHSIADFALLIMPRADIHLGAEWIPGKGPVTRQARPVALTEVQSLYSNFFREENVFNAGIKAGVLALLGLDINNKKTKTYQLVIDSAAVVGVNDPGNLSNPEGGILVWEGLKLESVSLLIPRSSIDAVNQRLKTLNITATVSNMQTQDGFQRISIPAFNLYAAYRLARLSNLMTAVCKDLVLEKATGLKANSTAIYVKSFTIGRTYTGRILKTSDYVMNHYKNEIDFIKEQEDQAMWPVANADSNCGSIIEIQCNNDVVKGVPKKIKVKAGCEAAITSIESLSAHATFESCIIPLSSRIEHGKFIRDEIEIDHLLFYPDQQYPEIELSAAIPQIVHRKTIQYINRFDDSNVNDW